jgi:hypothetical protein
MLIEMFTYFQSSHANYYDSSSKEVIGPPLWSSGQSSWLQIRRPGFDSRHYQIFCKKKKKKKKNK